MLLHLIIQNLWRKQTLPSLNVYFQVFKFNHVLAIKRLPESSFQVAFLFININIY